MQSPYLGSLASPKVAGRVVNQESRSLSIPNVTNILKRDRGRQEVALTTTLSWVILRKNSGGISLQSWRPGQGLRCKLVRLAKQAKKDGGTWGKVGGEECNLVEKFMDSVVMDGGKETVSRLPTVLAKVLTPRTVSLVWKKIKVMNAILLLTTTSFKITQSETKQYYLRF